MLRVTILISVVGIEDVLGMKMLGVKSRGPDHVSGAKNDEMGFMFANITEFPVLFIYSLDLTNFLPS